MKNFLFLLAVILVSACGFRPMYGDHAVSSAPSVQAALGGIGISNIPDRDGQRLRNLLLDRFYESGVPSHPRYLLKIEPVRETKNELDITIDEEATRAELRHATTFTLINTDTHQTLARRDVHALASYNILRSQFQTRVSEDNVRQNNLEDLARQIEQQVVLALSHGTSP